MRVGFVGWRGMVGSVLMQRMLENNDFEGLDAVFFTTSNVGGAAPAYVKHPTTPTLQDAYDLTVLATCDAIISAQGGDYTQAVYQPLREKNWQGYWIDAASTLRLEKDAIIILDPVNRDIIDQGLAQGIKNFIGGNCTVSLMLMALDGLFKADLIEHIHAHTYQAASGAGAQNMRELLKQMGALHEATHALLNDANSSILEIDQAVLQTQKQQNSAVDFPITQWGAVLAGSLISWIDKDLEDGQSKEELKGDVECNKILCLGEYALPNVPAKPAVVVESLCIRIGTMRSHAQALSIYLKKDLPLESIEALIEGANPWVKLIPNQKTASTAHLAGLHPVAVSNTLDVAIGRIRKLRVPSNGCVISAFTVGDQLLWGAAEPLRRMLAIIRKQL